MNRFFVLAILVGAFASANAQSPFTLVDGNSVVDGDASDRLLDNWFVDGVDQLFNQDYYYRVGGAAEASISFSAVPVVTMFGLNSANVSYTTGAFRFDITYTLIGGAPFSGPADIGEIVRVTNLTDAPLDFHLFEYDDFDLSGTSGGDTAALINSSTITQFDGLATVLVGSVPPFDRWEIDFYSTTFDKLNDGFADDLSNATSPLGPGDLTFAMQWNRVINPRGSFIMSKNKQFELVPEPATIAVLGLGFLALLRRRK